MARFDDLCLGCMKDKNGETVCPLCGFREQPVKLPYLPLRTVLAEKYVIGKMLSINGEGVTYIGYDTVLDSPVTIREYLPNTLCTRVPNDMNVRVLEGSEIPYDECEREFLRLSRIRARLRNVEAIIAVYDIFEENNTAYTVSEYVQGITFKDYLVKKGGILEWSEVRASFLPVLNALSSLHSAGVLHLAINPEHLLVERTNKLRLTGFSIEDVNTSHTDLSPQKFPGYTALEQYRSDVARGAWTDVYSIAAVMLTALTGVVPMDALKRVNDEKILTPTIYAERIPTNVLSAVVKALKPHPETRTRTIDQFKNEITASFSMSGVLDGIQSEPKPEKQINKQIVKSKQITVPKWALYTGIIAAIMIIIILIILLSGSGSSDNKIKFNSEVSVDETINTVKVPDLTNEDYNSMKESNNYEFNIELIGTMFSENIEEGRIAWQEPSADAKIKPGDTVTVMMSIGPRMRKIPKVEGLPASEAEVMLLKEGFKVTKKLKASSQVSGGEAISTLPEYNTAAEYGTEIILYINDRDEDYIDVSIPSTSSQAPAPSSQAPALSSQEPALSSQEPTSSSETSSNTPDVSSEVHTDIPPPISVIEERGSRPEDGR